MSEPRGQVGEFIEGLFGEGDVTHHALTPSGKGWTIMVCESSGWGTSDGAKINCPACLEVTRTWTLGDDGWCQHCGDIASKPHEGPLLVGGEVYQCPKCGYEEPKEEEEPA